MPSWPDAVSSWQPEELTASRPPSAVPPVFEVGAASAGLPEDLVAAARAAARAEGWSVGWADGMRAAADRAAAEAGRRRIADERQRAEARAGLERALAAVDSAAADLEQRALPGAAELEKLLLDAAFTIAEALVGHALRDDATRAPAALARVLALAPAGEPVTVRLSPADHALLTAADHLSGREVSLVADPTLEPGDAIATSGATEIDARIRAGVQRVRGVLAP
jgi:flagellar assembly protein FliH